jgi:hypothetical protein
MSDEVLCGLWTEHRINSRDEGFKDYRDSPPTSSLLCALAPGTLIVETSEPLEPCAHVLRYTGPFHVLEALLAELHEAGWEDWLVDWKKVKTLDEAGWVKVTEERETWRELLEASRRVVHSVEPGCGLERDLDRALGRKPATTGPEPAQHYHHVHPTGEPTGKCGVCHKAWPCPSMPLTTATTEVPGGWPGSDPTAFDPDDTGAPMALAPKHPTELGRCTVIREWCGWDGPLRIHAVDIDTDPQVMLYRCPKCRTIYTEAQARATGDPTAEPS